MQAAVCTVLGVEITIGAIEIVVAARTAIMLEIEIGRNECGEPRRCYADRQVPRHIVAKHAHCQHDQQYCGEKRQNNAPVQPLPASPVPPARFVVCTSCNILGHRAAPM